MQQKCKCLLLQNTEVCEMYEVSVLNVLTFSYKPVALNLITKTVYISYKAGESQKIFSFISDEYFSHKKRFNASLLVWTRKFLILFKILALTSELKCTDSWMNVTSPTSDKIMCPPKTKGIYLKLQKKFEYF